MDRLANGAAEMTRTQELRLSNLSCEVLGFSIPVQAAAPKGLVLEMSRDLLREKGREVVKLVFVVAFAPEVPIPTVSTLAPIRGGAPCSIEGYQKPCPSMARLYRNCRAEYPRTIPWIVNHALVTNVW